MNNSEQNSEQTALPKLKYERPELSNKTLPDHTKRYGDTDFQLEAAFIMLDNKEFEHLQFEEYGGIKPDSIEEKEVKIANNAYDLRNFFHDHMAEIKQSKELQLSLKKKLEGLMQMTTGQTELALLIRLQFVINDLLEDKETD